VASRSSLRVTRALDHTHSCQSKLILGRGLRSQRASALPAYPPLLIACSLPAYYVQLLRAQQQADRRWLSSSNALGACVGVPNRVSVNGTRRCGKTLITKPLLAILEMRKHTPDGTEHGPEAYVFGNAVGEPRKDFSNCWGRVCEMAKITDLHFHDLRREAASRWLESGVIPLHEISEWLGHDDLNTTAIYVRTKRVSLRHAADRWERYREEQEKQQARKAKPRRPPSGHERTQASVTIN
jgi:hypothetical protein